MNHDDVLNGIANWTVLSSFVPLLVFVILYAARSPWRATELGIALMYQKISFLLVFVVIGGSLFLGEYPLRWLVRTIVYLAVVVFLWLDVVNLLRYQHRTRFDEPKRRVRVRR